ncbi:hypothetical protein OG21DRAFT_748193 [Imleria badia]|nr:hypothetical protein OG21DRAFT_748193 [Imleria badia]
MHPPNLSLCALNPVSFPWLCGAFGPHRHPPIECPSRNTAMLQAALGTRSFGPRRYPTFTYPAFAIFHSCRFLAARGFPSESIISSVCSHQHRHH